MILVDPRVGSRELLSGIRMAGVSAELAPLEYGDACFDGNGKDGTISVGVERKTLHDMLHCIDDSRYSAHQLPGMKQMYGLSILLIEGHWRPHDQDGSLMEGFRDGQSWGPCRYRSQRTLYSKLRRYLISVSLAGVIVTYSRNLSQSSIDICEWFRYFQKKWTQHTSLMELQRENVPTLAGKPALVRTWANCIEDIGVKYSLAAEELFKTPIRLANSSENDWMQIGGIGPKTAIKVVKEIRGWK